MSYNNLERALNDGLAKLTSADSAVLWLPLDHPGKPGYVAAGIRTKTDGTKLRGWRRQSEDCKRRK